MRFSNSAMTIALLKHCALTLGVGAALCLSSCEPSDDSCSCTMRACNGYMELTLLPPDGEQLEYGVYTVNVEIDGETWESFWPLLASNTTTVPNELFFDVGLKSDGYLTSMSDGFNVGILEQADEIRITIFIDDVEVFRETRSIEHYEEVCNECGGGPRCLDRMYMTTEPMSIQLPADT